MRVAAARVDVSPTSQVVLGASDAARLPWVGTIDPIEANLLAMWSDDLTSAVLVVSIDCLYVGPRLRRLIEEASNLQSVRVLTFASHTHRAPMVDESKPRLGHPDESYMQFISEKLAQAVFGVMNGSATDVEMSAASERANHSINRRLRKRLVVSRRPALNQFVNAPNADGPTDETIVTATLRDESGKAVAVIWNYACHPVGAPRSNAVSAHYIGRARERVRASEGCEDLPVLFLQGFSGNTRPVATARAWTLKRRLRELVMGPLFEDMSPCVYESWTASLAGALQQAREREVPIRSDSISVVRLERSGLYGPEESPIIFSKVDVGEEFSIVGISGEVVAEYALPARGLIDRPFVCCAGCLDATFGYVPTTRILEEGGYEGGGYLSEFGLKWINPSIESQVLRTLQELGVAGYSGDTGDRD